MGAVHLVKVERFARLFQDGQHVRVNFGALHFQAVLGLDVHVVAGDFLRHLHDNVERRHGEP